MGNTTSWRHALGVASAIAEVPSRTLESALPSSAEGLTSDIPCTTTADCKLKSVIANRPHDVQLWKGSVAGILQFLQHRGSHHGGCHLRIVWMYFHTGPSRLCFGECPISVHISVQCLFEDVRWICAAVGSRESSHKDVYDSRKWCNLVLKRASHDVPNSVCTKVHR